MKTKKKKFFFEENFSSSFENLLLCSERRWFQLKGIKNWTKQVGKQIILLRYVCNFSLCTHSGKQQYRQSCNIRLTAATHTRTYTINNTRTSSTDSKHNILQFDLAKKGKKKSPFFHNDTEEACNCFTFRKKHVFI